MAAIVTVPGTPGDDVLTAIVQQPIDCPELFNGGPGNDAITAGAPDDILNGGAGNDTLMGGVGNDMLFGGAGEDDLNGGANDDTLHGGADNDTLQGAGGHDLLIGGGAHDLLNGATGNDTLRGGSGRDTLVGGGDDDVLMGNGQGDVLFGSAGDDTLNGGAGDDILEGGDGQDQKVGGTGADTFRYTDAAESLPGRLTRDIIFDFTPGVDVINLSAIDANSSTPQDDAFVCTGSGGTDAFSGAGGEVRYGVNSAGNLILQVDIAGMGAMGTPDMSIQLNGISSIDCATDLFL